MKDDRNIGIFDSGFGGLTVLLELQKKFPNESISYFADTLNVPYGEKSRESVAKLVIDSVSAFMHKVDLKFLIIACNTATACAISILQKQLKIPVIGVIDSGVFYFLKYANINSVAILATSNTIKSKIYEKKLKTFGYNGKIFNLACPLIVPLIEEGINDGKISKYIVNYYSKQLSEIPDAIILGCTHYPLLIASFRVNFPITTLWLDSGLATVSRVKFNPCTSTSPGKIRCFVTSFPKRFKILSSVFIGKNRPYLQVEFIKI